MSNCNTHSREHGVALSQFQIMTGIQMLLKMLRCMDSSIFKPLGIMKTGRPLLNISDTLVFIYFIWFCIHHLVFTAREAILKRLGYLVTSFGDSTPPLLLSIDICQCR